MNYTQSGPVRAHIGRPVKHYSAKVQYWAMGCKEEKASAWMRQKINSLGFGNAHYEYFVVS